MNTQRLSTLVLITLISSGCTWVKPTDEGAKVQVLTAAEAAECIDIGKTTASLVDKVAGIERSRTKVKYELLTLARNSAANMGGDTIVPTSEISDGQQSFTVYKCTGTKAQGYRFPPLSEPEK